RGRLQRREWARRGGDREQGRDVAPLQGLQGPADRVAEWLLHGRTPAAPGSRWGVWSAPRSFVADGPDRPACHPLGRRRTPKRVSRTTIFWVLRRRRGRA